MAVKALSHGGFRGGVAGTLDVGRVAQQRVDALLAQRAEAAEVGHAVLRGGVDLEVARHDDRADRRFDGEGHGVGDGVVDVDEFHGEAPGLDDVAGVVGDELGLAQQLVLLQLQLDQTQRQGRGVDGRVDCLKNIGKRADVVLMAVGNEIAAQLFLILGKIGHVRDDQIDAVHVVLRETKPAVHDDHVLTVFQHGHVFADLVKSAEGDNFQFFCQMVFAPFCKCFVICRGIAAARKTKQEMSFALDACGRKPSAGKLASFPVIITWNGHKVYIFFFPEKIRKRNSGKTTEDLL